MSDDLWGELPSIAGLKTPHAILAEQAQILEKKTNGLLIGRVTRIASNTGASLRSRLLILAPSLKYSYRVLELYSEVTLYPVKVDPDPGGPSSLIVARNETELTNTLRSILSSDRVKNVIAGLLAQLSGDADDQEKLQTE